MSALLSGKVALVTGAGHGIGRGHALELARQGATVVVNDLGSSVAGEGRGRDADDVVDVIRAAGGSAAADYGDVGDEEQAEAMVQRAHDEFGKLDIVVNNAGIFPTTGPMLNATDDFVHRMLDVNLRAHFSVARESAKRMTGGGSIVNMASVAALGGGSNISAYSASKAGVVALTRAFARELGPLGIRVNAIAPGIIDTPGVQAQMAPLKAGGLDIEARIAANPVGLAGQPDHIARAAVFLASDLAEFISGHVLVVDGGAHA
jgi:2-deoxy-D-gluconate 3-dehydrogenase